MSDFDFAAAAEKFAHVAVLGGRVKKAIDWSQLLNNPTAQRYLESLRDPTAQRYLVGGLGGAALGAGIGALQPQRKSRNALLYGLLGGVGGLSAAHLTSGLTTNTMPRTREEIEARIAQLQENKTTAAANEAGKAFTSTVGQNLLPTVERTGQAAVGGGVGLLAGRTGRRATTALGNAITGARFRGWPGAVLRGAGATLPFIGAVGGAIGGAGAQELARPFIVPPETNQQ
jgi:hypothetical protein